MDRYVYGVIFMPCGEVVYLSDDERKVRTFYEYFCDSDIFGMVAFKMVGYYPINKETQKKERNG